MTKDDVIQTLCTYGIPQDETEFQKAIDIAIKYLEALNKALKVINEGCTIVHDDYDRGVNSGLYLAAEIINNFLEEVENENQSI